ncbi:10 TM acyl transferase domain found in Cas1p-domain-containing protein [Mycena rebaudengoi]|nr:10 TM acyl transferase domain found in Cas1p-domain-containing protein [Mycena rebaudengoi]
MRSYFHVVGLICCVVSLVAALARYILFDSPLHCEALLNQGAWLDHPPTEWQPHGCMLHAYTPSDGATCLGSRDIIFIGDSITRQLFHAFGRILAPAVFPGPFTEENRHRDQSLLTDSGTGLMFFWDPFLNRSRVYTIIGSREKTSDRPALLVLGTVVVLPVANIILEKLSPERRASMRPADIDAMNQDLFIRINAAAVAKYPHSPPVALPLVFNQILHPSQTADGVHFSEAVTRTQANILLNLRCNDDQRTALVISAVVTLTYLADRTGLWLKEQKTWSPLTFASLCLAALAVGLVTLKRGGKDLGVLNREQTDEWKGWMQVVILIYHYTAASKISGVYNPIRVLVAAYVFMTGYGHTMFYLLKADYSFSRVARQVLIRANFSATLLAYTMGNSYISYYFAPMVSLWFLVIYSIMAVGSRFNGCTPILLGKIFCSAGLMAFFMAEPWPLEATFKALHRVCGTHWSATEFGFRMKLDLFIAYVGQLTALAVIKMRAHPPPAVLTKLAVGVAVAALIWFFAFELSQASKFTYNAWHPWISWVPILAYVVLRNASASMRSASSQAFAFIGRCSMETFVIQYHYFLSADTKGVLLVIPGTVWRPLNFVVVSTAFIYISHLAAEAIDEISKRGTTKSERLPFTEASMALKGPSESSGSHGEVDQTA